uniref:Uncharacterized protein n=1 Tax=Arundo donax TaxID=35708 RepID=A0A0A9DU33_ARUDO
MREANSNYYVSSLQTRQWNHNCRQN